MLIIVTITSILFALVMSVVAWRATRVERERSNARVELLRQAIAATADELPLRPAAVRDEPEAVIAGDMFAGARPRTSGSRWGLAIAVGAFAVAAVAALVVVFGGEAPGTRIALASESAHRSTPSAQPASPKPLSSLPLELVALTHDRDGEQLTVHGLVRNPAAGTEVDRLSAVVVLFNKDGNVVTTGRAAAASSALIPGGESTFAVTVPDAADIARYRVSFRTDQRVVAHVDKRVAR